MSMSNFINPFNEMFSFQDLMGFWDADTPVGLIKLSGEIERQAAMIGYINAFYLLALTGFIALPLIFFVEKQKNKL